MNEYRPPIIVFGMIIPLLFIGSIVAAAAFGRARVKESFAEKSSAYRTNSVTAQAAQEVEKAVTAKLPHLERWQASLSEETASIVNSNLREVYATLPGKEIQQTAFEPGPASTFGNASKQKSSQVRIALRGTFRTLQRAFLDLESRLPQLQLEELRMEPVSPTSSQINCQVNFTIWERTP